MWRARVVANESMRTAQLRAAAGAAPRAATDSEIMKAPHLLIVCVVAQALLAAAAMANQTDPQARQIHGSDPQHLLEKIVRLRVYESRYWKETCFGLSALKLVDVELGLEYVGGVYSHAVKPTPFLCLVLKMLQIQPDESIVLEFVAQRASKYLRVLGAFYARLTLRPAQVYAVLEPLLADRRRIARRTTTGWALTHVDEVVDELLASDTCLGIALPRLTQRAVLVATGALAPRVSALDDEIDDDEEDEEDEAGEAQRDGEDAGMAAGASGASAAAAAAAAPSGSVATAADAAATSAGAKRPRAEGAGWLAQLQKRKAGGSEAPPAAAAAAPSAAHSATAASSAAAAPPPPDGAVEAWNLERAKLGLKPLK